MRKATSLGDIPWFTSDRFSNTLTHLIFFFRESATGVHELKEDPSKPGRSTGYIAGKYSGLERL